MDISRKSVSVDILSGLLQYFPKNRAILGQKLGDEKKLLKYVSGYFMTKNTKKNLLPLNPRGGRGGG